MRPRALWTRHGRGCSARNPPYHFGTIDDGCRTGKGDRSPPGSRKKRRDAPRAIRPTREPVQCAACRSAICADRHASRLADSGDAAASASRDATPSDFEKLLEAELDASGIFGNASAPPQVKAETREAANFTGNATAPVVRSTPPITGATPDLSSEEEVARLLGEIAVNRKS